MKALKALLNNRRYDLTNWVGHGFIPYHYKRLSVSWKEALRLAALGQAKIGAYFGDKLFFTQAVIAGACLSGDYDNVVVVTPSQYGKTWLMGRIVPIRAFENKTNCFIAGGDADKTTLIQQNVFRALQDSAPEIRNALNTESKDKLDKLATSVSKARINFTTGGMIEPVSLGESYSDLSRNKAVGRGGDYFVDEAALVSNDTYAELGRRDFNSIDGSRGLMVLISNPHNPGYFYDELTNDNPDDRTLIVWIDALTAVEEGRTTAERVLSSSFAKNKSTRRRYLLCELEDSGDSMFGTPKVFTEDEGEYKEYFVGIDPAYKGKDNISMATVSLDEDYFVRVEEITTIRKDNWFDGYTGDDIVKTAIRHIRSVNAGMVCVDAGQGIYLIEGLNRPGNGIFAKGVHFGEQPSRQRKQRNDYAATNAADKRAEMHIDLQQLIDDDGIAFHQDAWEQVKDIFPFVTYERQSNNKIRVCKKSEIRKSIGRSPDELDAVLLAIQALMIAFTCIPQYITEHEQEEE